MNIDDDIIGSKIWVSIGYRAVEVCLKMMYNVDRSGRGVSRSYHSVSSFVQYPQ